ncbi:MAG: hypothetical protein H0W76_16035 [Pyrinomonadaceae bacterium]|nr:hypothetical protein [Pyrinomonadaceae bacterium]
MKLSLGGIVGMGLKAIGLGKIAPFISAAINFATGNPWAAAMDAAEILGGIKGLGFLKNVAAMAPLGGFGKGGFNPAQMFSKGGGLSLSCLGDIRSLFNVANTATGGKLNKFSAALNLIDNTLQTTSMIRQTMADFQTANTRI